MTKLLRVGTLIVSVALVCTTLGIASERTLFFFAGYKYLASNQFFERGVGVGHYHNTCRTDGVKR